MKYLALAATSLLSISLIARQNAPEIRFHAQADFFKLPPDLYFGEAAGVAVKLAGFFAGRESMQRVGKRPVC